MKDTELPIASHEGKVHLSGFDITCYNLPNGQRVLSRIGVLKAIGRTGKAKGGRKYDQESKLPVFLTANNLKPFISNKLIEDSNPIIFKDLSGNEAIGYSAEILPSVCYVFLDAQKANVLRENQIHIAQRAESLIRAFATVGIIALVDEATGFQNAVERAKDELQQLLSKILLTEHAKWIKTYPDEFFEMIFKMKGWTWISITKTKRPQVIGHYINDLIYSRLAPKVLTELREKNPADESGVRKTKHHQWFTPDFGNPKLKEHIAGILALGRASAYNWTTFMKMVNRSYPKFGDTIPLLFPNEDPFGETKQIAPTQFNRELKGLLAVPKPEK